MRRDTHRETHSVARIGWLRAAILGANDGIVSTASLIAGMPPMAAMVNKDMVNAAFETTLDQGLLYERRLFQILAATEDKAEGMAAFIEKREGVWKGR